MANDFFDGVTTSNGTYEVIDQGARQLITALQNALNTLTSGDATTAIESFNEIIAFLENVSDSSTLQGIIAGLNTSISAKYSKPSSGIPETDFSQAVRNILGLAATALQPSSLNGYVQTSTLNGYYTKTEVNNLLVGKANLLYFENHQDMEETGLDNPAICWDNDYEQYYVWDIANAEWRPIQNSALANVARSGSYNDLTNKPNIPAAQVQSDWNAISGLGVILNKPNIPTNVSDLTNDIGYITTTNTPLVVVSSTGNVSQSLDSGKWYRFGTIDSLTLTLNSVGNGFIGTYFGRFTASSNWTNIVVPNGITNASSNDTVESGKTYEFSIIDNIIKINEV